MNSHGLWKHWKNIVWRIDSFSSFYQTFWIYRFRWNFEKCSKSKEIVQQVSSWDRCKKEDFKSHRANCSMLRQFATWMSSPICHRLLHSSVKVFQSKTNDVYFESRGFKTSLLSWNRDSFTHYFPRVTFRQSLVLPKCKILSKSSFKIISNLLLAVLWIYFKSTAFTCHSTKLNLFQTNNNNRTSENSRLTLWFASDS